MAQIIGLKEKQEALAEIQSKIRSLETLNKFLQAENPSHEYVVSFAKTKAPIFCEEKETIDALVKAYKEKVVEEINKKSAEFSICLDEEDNKIMNELFVPARNKA